MSIVLDNEFFTLYEISRDENLASCQFQVKPPFKKYRGLNKLFPIENAYIKSLRFPQFDNNLRFFAPGSLVTADKTIIQIENSIVDSLAEGESIKELQDSIWYLLIPQHGPILKYTCKETVTSGVKTGSYDVALYVGDKSYEIPDWTGAIATPYEKGYIRLTFTKKEVLNIGWVLLYFRLLLRPNSFSLTKEQKDFFYNPDLTKADKKITCPVINWVRFLKYAL